MMCMHAVLDASQCESCAAGGETHVEANIRANTNHSEKSQYVLRVARVSAPPDKDIERQTDSQVTDIQPLSFCLIGHSAAIAHGVCYRVRFIAR